MKVKISKIVHREEPKLKLDFAYDQAKTQIERFGSANRSIDQEIVCNSLKMLSLIR